ncbi:MAG: HvfC/BufC N-terminal domain-containing protein [Gammaproteobacteria bacterium]
MKDLADACRSQAWTLADLQRTFHSTVLRPAIGPPPFIVDSPHASAVERFGVYAEAYRLRLVEALSADYPAIQEWLGDEAFGQLGRAYADAYPSSHFSIRWFGRHLPDFLGDSPAYCNQPAFQELAAFEWAMSEAFDAADNPPITEIQMASVDAARWPQLRLAMHPSLRTLELNYNTPIRWKDLNRKESPPPLEKLTERVTWAVWRQNLRILFRSLAYPESRALKAFQEGLTFAEVCERMCEWLDETEVAIHAAQYLRTWLQEGWITGISTSNEDPTFRVESEFPNPGVP